MVSGVQEEKHKALGHLKRAYFDSCDILLDCMLNRISFLDDEIRGFANVVAPIVPDFDNSGNCEFPRGGLCLDDGGKIWTANGWKTTLERVVEELSLPNVVYVNGLHALPEKDTLSSGSVHPSPQGHEEIARFLLSKFM